MFDKKLVWATLAASALWTGCSEDTETPDASTADAGVVQDAAIEDATPAHDATIVDASQDAGLSPDAEVGMDAAPGDTGGFPTHRWIKFEPPGAVCADGSQYKFFVNFSDTSSNVAIYLEGGGACWDYASCTGNGARTAANRNGIPDDYANRHAQFGTSYVGVDLVYPLLNANAQANPMADWNKVFIPYCTGDVHSGSATVTYQDPAGVGPDVVFHHVGRQNVQAVIDQLGTMFPHIAKMFVGGCSAGGAGALTNYYFFRTGLNADNGYLLDDSGPLFPDSLSGSRSEPLHDRVRAAWNVDETISTMPQSASILSDFGTLPEVLASEFPNDRLAQTLFQLDYNYSLYSYERFYEVTETGDVALFGDGSGLGPLGLDENDPVDRAAVYKLWWDDVSLLRYQAAAHNLGYYIPFYRNTNSSHCTTIPGVEDVPPDQVLTLLLSDLNKLAWAGTEMWTGTATITVKDYVNSLLDDTTPIQQHFESTGEGRYLPCTPSAYDAEACAAAH